jgi:hypothetical protein
MTADEINAAHKRRWAEAVTEHGSPWLPSAVAFKIGEQHRQDWCAFLGRDHNGTPTNVKRESREPRAATPPVPSTKRVVESAIARIVESENGHE